jgi:hypothetical protein
LARVQFQMANFKLRMVRWLNIIRNSLFVI